MGLSDEEKESNTTEKENSKGPSFSDVRNASQLIREYALHHGDSKLLFAAMTMQDLIVNKSMGRSRQLSIDSFLKK